MITQIRTRIRSKRDTLALLGQMEVGSYFVFSNPSLFGGGWGGKTRVEKVDDELFSVYSWGRGWCDQRPTTWGLGGMVNFVYRNRKAIAETGELIFRED